MYNNPNFVKDQRRSDRASYTESCLFRFCPGIALDSYEIINTVFPTFLEEQLRNNVAR